MSDFQAGYIKLLPRTAEARGVPFVPAAYGFGQVERAALRLQRVDELLQAMLESRV